MSRFFSLTVLARVFAIVLILATPGLGQDVARMEELVRSFTPNNRFMGAVLVARSESVLLNKGYGSANLEWEIPNSPATKFRIGSVTKQFTAAAMSLPVTTERLVARFRDKPLEFEPGEKMNYSNSGYALLGYLIEKISGQTYAQFLQEHIFKPLGMSGSGYDSNSVVIPQRAAGYGPGPNGPVNTAFLHMTIPHGAGALYSTTEDLLRWNRALYGGKLLSAVSLKKMTTPFKNNYGFGIGVSAPGSPTRYAHNGGINGFNSFLAYYPESRVTVVVLANVNGPAADDLGGKLSALALAATP